MRGPLRLRPVTVRRWVWGRQGWLRAPGWDGCLNPGVARLSLLVRGFAGIHCDAGNGDLNGDGAAFDRDRDSSLIRAFFCDCLWLCGAGPA